MQAAPGQPLKVHTAYNATAGVTTDLVDVLKQKANEYPGVSFAELVGLYIFGINNPSQSSGTYAQLIQDAHQYIVHSLIPNGYVSLNDSDLKSVVADIRSEAAAGQTVLLVPHSQGNLYANSAYAELTSGEYPLPPGSLGIMGVASPASYVANKGNYQTSNNDLVIESLRGLYPMTLLPKFMDQGVRTGCLGAQFHQYLHEPRVGRAGIYYQQDKG